ncbi:MAG: ABC transporter permease [Acidobacteria bacterium]|nr:ABC transporter permease [Acidobacteriota bacterium]
MLDVELAFRFLKKRAGLLLRGTALAALVGIALATMALVITLALMAGYRQAIAGALQQGNAHLVGFAPLGLERDDVAEVSRSIAAIDGVTRAKAVTYVAGLAEVKGDPGRPLPVVLKAVAAPPGFTGIDAWSPAPPISGSIGAGLAGHLGIGVGDRVTVQLPPAPGSWVLPSVSLEVVDVFSLSFSEFDNRWIIVPLDAVLEAAPSLSIAGIEVELADPLAVKSARSALEAAQPDLMFTDWREMNRSLFAALRWQTLSLFVVLTLVVAVASFQVSSALIVLAIDKRRTAGMLQALGATGGRIWRILTIAGITLGGAGVAIGASLGVAVAAFLTVTRTIRFPEHLAKVYLVDHVSFIVMPLHLAAVVGVCSALVVLASAWPAVQSARRDPAASLRAV